MNTMSIFLIIIVSRLSILLELLATLLTLALCWQPQTFIPTMFKERAMPMNLNFIFIIFFIMVTPYFFPLVGIDIIPPLVTDTNTHLLLLLANVSILLLANISILLLLLLADISSITYKA